MVQAVHTALAQAALAPPSFNASSREPSARVASAATVMAVPSAMAKVRSDARPEHALRQREHEHEDGPGARPDADRKHHRHDLAPGEGTGEFRASTMWSQ